MIDSESSEFIRSNFQADQRRNPWLTIWFRPRATIRHLIDTSTEFDGWIVVAILAGIGYSLGEAWFNADADTSSSLRILANSIITGILGVMIYLLVSTFLIHKIGQIMGGKASKQQVLAVLGWSAVPYAWGLLIWTPLLLFPAERFFSENALNQPGISADLIIFIMIFIFYTVQFVWVMVLLCKGLGEVQKFSGLKALGNVILSFVILSIPYYFLLAIWQ